MSSFPIKLKPNPDEVFSSWITRLAWAHGLSGQKFFTFVCPQITTKYFNPDRIIQPDAYEQISSTTGISPQEIKKTTVIYYAEKFIYEVPLTGPIPWILPFVFANIKYPRIYGIQFCPKCLSENPYFRVSHRIAFMVVCPIHRLQLLDRCQHCYSPINYFQQSVPNNPDTFTFCYSCKEDLRIIKPNRFQLFEVQNDEIEFQNQLFKAIHKGRVKFLRGSIFSVSWLIRYLDDITKRCYTTQRSKYFQYAVSKYFNVDFHYFMRPLGGELIDFSTLSVYERRICFNVLKLLLQNGPDTYKDFLKYFSKAETNEEIEQLILSFKQE